MTFELGTYLDRIGLDAVSVSYEGLAAMQRAHMLCLPFENIDIFLGSIPDLDLGALWQKIIVEGRSGCCLELNTLFQKALEVVGFTVTAILSRNLDRLPRIDPRNHHLLLVELDEKQWLTDVGFGSAGPISPLRIDTEEDQVSGGATFRVRPWERGETLVERKSDEIWIPLYSFEKTEAIANDLVAASVVVSRWSGGYLPKNLIVAIYTPEGRISLFDRHVKRIEDGRAEQFDIGSPAQLEQILNEAFHLRCTRDLADRLWARMDESRIREVSGTLAFIPPPLNGSLSAIASV